MKGSGSTFLSLVVELLSSAVLSVLVLKLLPSQFEDDRVAAWRWTVLPTIDREASEDNMVRINARLLVAAGIWSFGGADLRGRVRL